MDTLDAYLAGATDADGFISIGRKVSAFTRKDGTKGTYYIVKIGLLETRSEIPDLLQATFPAWRGEHTPRNKKHKKWFIWQACNDKAKEPLLRLLPYLILKRRQAELGLRMIELLREQNRGRFMAIRLTPEQERERYDIYREVTQSNAPRNRRVHFVDTPSPVDL